MLYCQQCGTALPKDANFCPACGIQVLEIKPVERHHVLKVTGKPKLIVINAAPGSVKIESGSKEDEITVDLDLRLPQHLDCNVSQDENIIKVNCRAQVGVWGWPSYIFRSGPRANIFISVPSKADLDLETRAGRIAVSGVKGTITAESSAGTLSIQNCEGLIKARTRAGSVNLENVNGTVTARSSAGSIKFSGILSKGENWFRTSVGSIDISLKGEPNLVVEASTSLGSIRCVPELANAYQRRNHYTGQIGAGAGRLIAETKTGSITIRH
ncbi:MAG: DUF4097 family beta strand repeat protein [Candidatus Bathyarchaeota archaeon]|nr:MAG: DUF4097 family beta strand repeat protein [Candidatus Bathyarchaeota archaeon]